MIKKVIDNKTLTENARFEGYCIDLLEKIAKLWNKRVKYHTGDHCKSRDNATKKM
jgi:hypothetical protein